VTAPRKGPVRRAAGSAADDALLFAMLRLVDLAVRPLQGDLGRHHGLALSEWRTLAVVEARPGCAATEIARHSGLDKMSVSRALASLEADGRIARRADPRDARRSLAVLTPAGRALCRALRDPAADCEAALVAALGVAERRQLRALVERMTARLHVAVGPPPA
jgi:DNA-binding MarR family transcriptional regulator